MKKQCPEYFESESVWKKCLFVLDANVLIKLHEDDKNRKRWFSILEKVKDRIWLPHQFATEYLDHRASRTRRHITNTGKKVKDQFGLISKAIRDLDALPESQRKDLLDKVEKIEKSCTDEFGELAKSTPVSANTDPVRKEFEAFFEDRVGPTYSNDKFLEILQEGEVRHRNGIPPGYTDSGKSTNKAGDLIAWKQMIDEVSARQIPVMLVTLERKSDWWKVIDGEPAMARPELSREMRKQAGQSFAISNFHDFIKWVADEFEMDSKAVTAAIESAKITTPAFTIFETPATSYATLMGMPSVTTLDMWADAFGYQQPNPFQDSARRRLVSAFDAEKNRVVFLNPTEFLGPQPLEQEKKQEKK